MDKKMWLIRWNDEMLGLHVKLGPDLFKVDL